MSDNWVVQNLENALNTWNEKLAEIWQLITQSPQQFKGGTIWSVIVNIHGAVQAIGLALLVLFFVVGVVKTCGSFAELKKPEHALKLFIRFALAKGVVTYGLQLMMALFEIVQGLVSTIQAVESMRIPAALSKIKSGFSHAAQSMRQYAGQIDVIRGELHEVGGHMKNAGRAFLGRPAKQNGILEANKGVLAKLRGVLESCGAAFSKMARGADKLMEKAQRGKEPEEQKQSVKSELRQLKTEHSEKAKVPVSKEQAR